MGAFVYQQRAPIINPTAGTDTLQFVGNEEGRARWAYHKYLSGGTGYGWEYDFLEKDHLGNTRVMLSQEKDTAQYVATMETVNQNTEDALFYNIPQSVYPVSSIPGTYPTDNTTVPNSFVAKLNGSLQRVGPAILLKVMSGDKFDLAVKSFYHSGGTVAPPNSYLTDILSSLANGLVSAAGGTKGSFTQLDNSGSNGPLMGALNAFNTSNDNTPTDRPKAYLNWLIMDNQLQPVVSKAYLVGSPESLNGLGELGILVPKSGYLYIWVSNETPGWDVFFDNLSVITYNGPLLEENHYYPGGLTMAGISDKALKANYAENKYRFNAGSELQNKEFSDGSGLEMYETRFRGLDVQLGGRFWQQDPLAVTLTDLSPYQYATNNPVSFSDPLGLDTVRISGEGAHKIQIRQGDVLAWTMGESTSYYTYDPSNENAVNGFVGGGIDDGSMQAATVTAQSQHGDDASPWRVGTEWLTGTGPREHHFRGADPFTRELRKHDHIAETRGLIASGLASNKLALNRPYSHNYALGGLSGVPKYIRDYSTLLTGGLTGNIAVTYLGSYGLKYEITSIDEESGTAQVHFSVTNSSTIESATHPPVIGYTSWWSNNIGKPLNNFFSSGPLSPTTQTFDWNETIKYK
jgi:RHS repeat-associated protein